MVPMHPAAIHALLCPVCADSFELPQPGAGALVCRSGHSFDIAKQGYVNLLTGAGTHFTPDTAQMVQARAEFLAAGHYAPLAEALADAVAAGLASSGQAGGLVVDAGTGTGYYLAHLLLRTEAPSVGLDISKYALRRAARANPQTVNLVWDLWRPLPLAAKSAAAVVVVFAPRNSAEFARILRPSGVLAVVTPLPGHLAEIVDAAGLLGQQEGKQEALAESLAEYFCLSREQDVHYRLELDREDVVRVALMGPAGHHRESAEVRARVAELPEITAVTVRFRISLFEPLP